MSVLLVTVLVVVALARGGEGAPPEGCAPCFGASLPEAQCCASSSPPLGHGSSSSVREVVMRIALEEAGGHALEVGEVAAKEAVPPPEGSTSEERARAAARARKEAVVALRMEPSPRAAVALSMSEEAAAASRQILYMERVRGVSLHEWARGARGGDGRTALRVVTEAAAALEAVHAAGVAHLDVQPRNFVVPDDPAEAVRVVDFSLAESSMSLDDGRQRALYATLYAAPEQRRDVMRPVMNRTDAFGWALVAAFTLAGGREFWGDERAPTAGEVLEGVRASGAADTAGGAALLDAMRACLAEDPAARPASLASVLAELPAVPDPPAVPWRLLAARGYLLVRRRGQPDSPPTRKDGNDLAHAIGLVRRARLAAPGEADRAALRAVESAAVLGLARERAAAGLGDAGRIVLAAAAVAHEGLKKEGGGAPAALVGALHLARGRALLDMLRASGGRVDAGAARDCVESLHAAGAADEAAEAERLAAAAGITFPRWWQRNDVTNAISLAILAAIAYAVRYKLWRRCFRRGGRRKLKPPKRRSE